MEVSDVVKARTLLRKMIHRIENAYSRDIENQIPLGPKEEPYHIVIEFDNALAVNESTDCIFWNDEEGFCLIVTNGKNGTHVKIDHPEISSCFEFDYKNAVGEQKGTKDLADAAVGALWACYKKYSEFLEDGGNGTNKQLQLVTQMTRSAAEDSNQQFQSMLEGLF